MVLKAASIVGALVIAWLVTGSQYDFVFDWLATRAFVEGGDPYQPLHSLASAYGHPHVTTPWIAPRLPGALLLQTPIGWLPYAWIYVVGRLLTVASAFLLAWVVARIGRFDPKYAFLAVPLALLVWPFSTVLHYSQTGFLIAAFIGLAWLMGDRWAAGIPLGAAVMLKLWPWLLVPALWIDGRRKAAAGTAVMVGVFNLAGFAFPNITLEGFMEMMSAATHIGSPALASDLPILIPILVGLASVLTLGRLTHNIYLWAIPVALILAPVAWAHYLPVLLICWAYLARRESVDTTRPMRVSDTSPSES